MPTEPTPRLDRLRSDPRHRAARARLALAAVLHAEIERLDISIHELARRCGLSHQTLRPYFAGEREPGLSRVIAMEHALAPERGPGWLTAWVAGRLR